MTHWRCVKRKTRIKEEELRRKAVSKCFLVHHCGWHRPVCLWFSSFRKNTTYDRGNSINVRFIGVMNGQKKSLLHLFVKTKKLKTWANHVIEAIQRISNDKATATGLPPKLYVLFASCTQEKRFLNFIAFEVSLWLKNIWNNTYRFYLFEQTPEVIDHANSRLSKLLRSEDIVTLSDFYGALRASYNGGVRVAHMKLTINRSGLCIQDRALQRSSIFCVYVSFHYKHTVPPYLLVPSFYTFLKPEFVMIVLVCTVATAQRRKYY